MSTAVLTDREIHEEMVQESKARPLYNPSNLWITPVYSAQTFRLCPDGEALDLATGSIRETDGVTQIRDTWGRPWVEEPNGEGSVIKRQGAERVLLYSSVDIVKHIIKAFPFVARLTGDAKRDAAIKTLAKKKWVTFRLQWANQVKAGREAMLREFHASPGNSGQIPEAPNAMETEAYEFLAEYATGQIGRKEYVCKHDGYQTDLEEKWLTHQKAFHPDEAKTDADVAAGKRKGK